MLDKSIKKLNKIVGLKKSDFNEMVHTKQVQLRKPRLIPVYKLGDEMALTSVLLSSVKLIKEFREALLGEAKMQKGGKLYLYTEVVFADEPKSRFDGLLLVVKAGVIKDAAIVEVKNGRDILEAEQIERYQDIARRYSIPRFITISNEFVSDSSQSPVKVKKLKSVERYHLSWSYLLTIAHVLLFKNDTNIEDPDQVAIMREVVNYLEWDKSGVFGVNQMKAGWGQVVDKITANASLKHGDADVIEAVTSWQQEERDMALILSRDLGVLVSSGFKKYKGRLDERIKDDRKYLVENKALSSVMRVKGAVSDIDLDIIFDKRTVEMSVSLKPPLDKTLRGQLGWLKRQLGVCEKKEEELVGKMTKELYVDILLKSSRSNERCLAKDLDAMLDVLKGREIREFRLVYIKDFGKRFSSPKKFVDVIEAMLIDYYKGIVENLVKWEAPAPKISSGKQEATPSEDELESVLD